MKKPFLERLTEKIKNNPNQVVLYSDGYPDGITYQQLDEKSGRVCRFLKDRNIGREDYVMVLMPREASAYISILGIWKCGAAMTILEEDYPTERIEYIKKDLNCKLVITKDVFDEMMESEICSEYSLPQPHDACYATYTSGSTGNPKGILHEFGKLDTFDYDYDNRLMPLDGDGRFAIITPLNFGPSIRNAVKSLLDGKCLYVVPRDIVKNPKLLLEYFINNKIDETSVTCSFFRAYSFATEYMKNVFVHSEPCNDIYVNNVNVVNLYTLSEVAFPICTFQIDKTYEKVPLGYKNKNYEIQIINEKGERAKTFETGEIVVQDAFTRGYINLPDLTSQAFSNGYFHTGDMGYYDEKEMFFFSGRQDDMIKINGNRIEPMEIEGTVKRVLCINNALAKGFTEKNRSFIAVCLLRSELLEKELIDTEGRFVYSTLQMKEKMHDKLPEYMMPSYYVILDSYPISDNGKLLRSRIEKPSADEFRSDFEINNNNDEEYFCQLFKEVLKLKSVGLDDDFYEIGGDSLLAMEVVSRCDRFELTVSNIFEARTPRNLSRSGLMNVAGENLIVLNEKALLRPQRLLPEQQAIFESQIEFPELILNNLVRFYKLSEGIDVWRFKTAVDKVLKHHPVFSSVLINEGGIEKISYVPALYKDVDIISVSKDKFREIAEGPRKPFNMEKHLLYRCGIYELGREYYFYLEIHHLITDGISLKMLINEIGKCYYDDNVLLKPDYLFMILQKREKKTEKNALSLQQIRELYRLNNYFCQEDNSVRCDKPFNELIPSNYDAILNIDKDILFNDERYRKYKGNAFFLTCFLMAIAKYNDRNKAFSFWVYNGREQRIEENAHGMLIRSMPMGIEFDSLDECGEPFELVKNTIDRQIAFETECISSVTDDFMFSPYFVYQKNILHSEQLCEVFSKEIAVTSGCMAFEFHVIDNSESEHLVCSVKYAGGLYNQESITRFCRLFETVVINTLHDREV